MGVKSIEIIDSEEAIKLEQEVKKLLLEIPEVNNLFDLKSRTNILAGNELGDIKSSYSSGASKTLNDKSPGLSGSEEGESEGSISPEEENMKKLQNTVEATGKQNETGRGAYDIGTDPGESLVEDLKGIIRSNIASRRKKAGFKISFASRNDRSDLAWIEKDVIIINSSHPSYLKIKKSSAGRKIHNLFSIAIALWREMQDQGIIKDQDLFIDEIMSKWGKIKI